MKKFLRDLAILESLTFPVGWTMDKIWKEMEVLGNIGGSWGSVGGNGNTLECNGNAWNTSEVCGRMWVGCYIILGMVKNVSKIFAKLPTAYRGGVRLYSRPNGVKWEGVGGIRLRGRGAGFKEEL